MASLNHKRETEENTGRRRIEYRNKEEIRRKKEEYRRMLTSCVSESHTLCHKWVSRNPPKPLTH